MLSARSKSAVGTALPDWEEAEAYLSEDEFENELLGPKFPLSIDPSHVARRLAAQRSRFTIFGRATDGLTKICAKVKDSDCRLCRIPIKRAAAPNEMLAYLMETSGRTTKDLLAVFRTRGRVSEALSGKRPISKEQSKKLASLFKVTADLLI